MTQEVNPGLVFLTDVRLSFPHLQTPHASAEGSALKFSGDFILPPTHPDYAAFHAQAHALALEKFGAQTDAILQFIQSDRKLRAYGAGEEVIDKKTMLPMVGYPGNVYVKANNDAQPALFGADGVQLMDARTFYGGCYVNAQVKPWIQDNKHGRGIRCELVGVQFVRDGEPFGVAPVDPSTLFGAVPGAPATVAPGVVGMTAAQAVVPGIPGIPVGLPPGIVTPPQPVASGVVGAPAQPAGVYQVPPQSIPGAQPGVQLPGGYDPAAYLAPPVIQPGVAPSIGAPAAQVPGINPATGLPY